MATRERILRAATEEFARHGYRATTIRVICRRARVNVAAVNYHFGDKRALYRQVFAYLFEQPGVFDRLRPPLRSGDRPAWRRFLRDWVRTMVVTTVRPRPREALKLRLFCRELLDPSENFPELYAAYMRPPIAMLQRAFAVILPARTPRPVLLAHVFAVLAQGLFYHQHRPLIAATVPGKSFPDEAMDTIVAVIADNALRETADHPRRKAS